MKMYIGQDWQADFDAGYGIPLFTGVRENGCKYEDTPRTLLSLEGRLSIEQTENMDMFKYISEPIGLCLIRTRSNPISLVALFTQVTFVDGAYFVNWVSSGVFYPKPRVKSIEGNECRIFV